MDDGLSRTFISTSGDVKNPDKIREALYAYWRLNEDEVAKFYMMKDRTDLKELFEKETHEH